MNPKSLNKLAINCLKLYENKTNESVKIKINIRKY